VRGIDMHVHVPTTEWLGGCMGPYIDSVERYFGRRPEPTDSPERRQQRPELRAGSRWPERRRE
jgi:hypothetical protein